MQLCYEFILSHFNYKITKNLLIISYEGVTCSLIEQTSNIIFPQAAEDLALLKSSASCG